MSARNLVGQPQSLDDIAAMMIPMGFKIRELISQVGKKRGNLTIQKCYVLLLLIQGNPDDENGWSMTDLANSLGCSTAWATGVAEALEKGGQAERKHAEDDRRKVYLRITGVGREAIEACVEAFLQDLQSLESTLLPFFLKTQSVKV